MVNLVLGYCSVPAAAHAPAEFAIVIPGSGDNRYTLIERFPTRASPEAAPSCNSGSFFAHEKLAAVSATAVVNMLDIVRMQHRCAVSPPISVLRLMLAHQRPDRIDFEMPQGLSEESLRTVFEVARLLAVDAATGAPFTLRLTCHADDLARVQTSGAFYGFAASAITARD